MNDVLVAVLAGALVLTLTQDAAPQLAAAAAVELARTTVVQRFSLAPEAVRVVEVADATWKDSSLGCPEKSMAYTPAVVQGHVVVLDAAQPGGRIRHRVHVAGGRAVVCSTPAGSAARDLKLPPGNSAAGLRTAERARTHLAQRLKVDRQQIRIEVFRTTVWPDASLGCPVAGRRYEQEPVSGFTIFLGYGGKTYEYHADATRTVPLPDC